jgi:hypothetical protein
LLERERLKSQLLRKPKNTDDLATDRPCLGDSHSIDQNTNNIRILQLHCAAQCMDETLYSHIMALGSWAGLLEH